MKKLLSLSLILAASPVLAAEGPFFSLRNADFVVSLAFIVFVGALIYFGVPGMIGRMLDDRANGIKNSLDEARLLREEAQALLASYEAKAREVTAQSARIVEGAKAEAQAAAELAKADLAKAITRKLAAAEEQIESTVKAAEAAVRDRAVSVSVAVAAEVLKSQMTAEQAAASVDASIAQVAARIH
ncbi:F0F1 ATP synthase subunit B family protein [Stagnihabitans tardus]|uniref:ATP synthase subunit b n=1 Tax=Stagnihabitans tardus TaxID=2699202 RepID=A0AAE4YA74_9RHOB|nr:ATP F0F1 synthase subunit B [Stagnihabitans tardus]NBZ86564.1 ATP F0F1 synthase subunit B [Stagnihabitans tardus]